MILLHEEMEKEATYLEALIESVYNIPVYLVSGDLARFFQRLTMVEGYYCQPNADVLAQEFPDTAVFLLTRRDLYYGEDNKDDQWAFGANPKDNPFSVLSTARLMGKDSTPRMVRDIDEGSYLLRLAYLTIHELGHDLVHAPHHLEAFWVSLRYHTCDELGPHCDDNTCVMYEVVDVKAPRAEEGYLQLGSRQLFDAGLEGHLRRLRSDWFCERCRVSIKILDSYLRTPEQSF